MASMQYLDPQGLLLRQIDSLVLEASGLYHLDADLGNTSERTDTLNTLSGLVLRDLHTSRFNKPLILLLLTSLGQQAKLPPHKKADKTGQASPPGSSPKEKALASAHHCFFATRTTPGPITDAERLLVTLPRLFGQALARNNQTAPVTSLSVTINPRGTVSVTAPPTVPSTVYAPFFKALTTILNVEVATPENPFTTFRPALTNVDLSIHGVPLYELPNQECLEEILPSALKLAVGITPAAVWFLNTDEISRCSKATTSVVVSVTADEATTFGTTIRLFSLPRRCNFMWRASPSTKCRNCCKLGHATQGCRSPTACPLCTLPHRIQDHRCPVPSCKGASAPLENCCEISPAKCANCSGAHRSFTPSCPSRKPTTTANPPPQLTPLWTSHRTQRPHLSSVLRPRPPSTLPSPLTPASAKRLISPSSPHFS
ncbi:uncharacterized protein LAJ45_06848 [Morchella importuna]|uniref:uncharacterized protein n=1 Tax=Morchella importuna TaxID=1174673 RepID=UPI001E8D36B8|nr:uncharacterized protein LAJ45_06848 [Morchella importuna]KAH8149308.1 hypothetical protein LAJ45_06848 [Morchella importuna]